MVGVSKTLNTISRRLEERKDAVTVAFFVNAAGGKEKAIVIGAHKKPRAFKGKMLHCSGVQYEVFISLVMELFRPLATDICAVPYLMLSSKG